MPSSAKTIKLSEALFFAGVSLVVTLLHGDKFFFWDTISQISIPANYYYDNDFRYFFIPDADATGHPTFVAMYVALLWKIFGRTLLVAHLSMAPFIFGILYHLLRFIRRSDAKGLIIWAVFVGVIIDPTLVSQASLVTFDIVQLFFFLWCINSLLDRRPVTLSIAFALLCLTSLRGMISGAGIILYTVTDEFLGTKKISFRSLTGFIPGILLSVLFLALFYLNKHWVIHNTVSGKWIVFSQFASPAEVIRNIGIFGWRLIDFGRIGIWIVFAVILISLFRKKNDLDQFMKTTLILAATQFVVFLPFCIFYRNPFGHRYLLPVIIPVAVFTLLWILKNSKRSWLIYSALLIVLFSGWFWAYPVKTATGWDATPAHWPYYKLRNEMVTYIRNNEIPFEKIGSFFPNTEPLGITDISADKSVFTDDENLEKDYILFSNVYNQNDQVIDSLFSSGTWENEFHLSKGRVRMTLFKRKSTE